MRGVRRAASWCRPIQWRLPTGTVEAIGLLGELQRADLVRPGARRHHALTGEVVDLHRRIVPVAADQFALRLQQVERRRILRLR